MSDSILTRPLPPESLTRVLIESPYGSTVEGGRADAVMVERNVAYLHAAMLDALQRGEAPFASHAIYPNVLDDQNLDERTLGMNAGFAWAAVAEKIVVYQDLGITPGMKKGIERAVAAGQRVEYRALESGSWFGQSYR